MLPKIVLVLWSSLIVTGGLVIGFYERPELPEYIARASLMSFVVVVLVRMIRRLDTMAKKKNP